LALDRVSQALFVVFLLAAAAYLWAGGRTQPLALHGGASDPYNQLANAFLHLRTSVGRAPAELLSLPEPYNPIQNWPIQEHFSIHDFALYHGRLYITWGPAQAIVLLVPLHLLGFEPTSGLTTVLFAIAGLGFALAALRVMLRQIGEPATWMCVLAALALALSSVVPFGVRRPSIYEEAITGGYCFAMAGIWLAFSAMVDRRASPRRLALMSLCFGLAASRPSLALAGLVLVPVYMSLRRVRPRRGLLLALAAPFGVCLALLMAYNQARFGNPLEVGQKYQLAAFDQRNEPFGSLSYVPPGIWYYGVSPPEPGTVLPFLGLSTAPVSYPAGLPPTEVTDGLLPMSPIVILLATLPWIWRRRPALLGPLALPLLTMAGAGAGIVLFLTYKLPATSERYAIDFSTLLLFGALAAWLALSAAAGGRRRWLVRAGGGALVAWGCLAGFATGLTTHFS